MGSTQFSEQYDDINRSDLYLEDIGGYKPYSPEYRVGKSRIFCSVPCVSVENGTYVLVKVYLKSRDSSKRREEEKILINAKLVLNQINQKVSFKKQPNVLPFFLVTETERACYLVRQFCHSNLKDRMTTRPFPSYFIRLWYMYQLLYALRQLHNPKVGLFHGDVRAENILLTSYEWLFLTDLAMYKPLILSRNQIRPNFSTYFETSDRPTTNLAPERFILADGETPTPTPTNEAALENDPFASASSSSSLSDLSDSKYDAKFRDKIDVFSAGCVFAQMFLSGRAIFEFEKLLAYRKGETKHVDESLKEIKKKGIQELIRKMIALDPNDRVSLDEVWLVLRKRYFPKYLDSIHMFFSRLLLKSADERIQIVDIFFWDLMKLLEKDGEIVHPNLKSFLEHGIYKKYLREKWKEAEELRRSLSFTSSSSLSPSTNPKQILEIEDDEEEDEGEEDEERFEERLRDVKISNLSEVDRFIRETEQLTSLIKDGKAEEFEKKVREEIRSLSSYDPREERLKRQKDEFRIKRGENWTRPAVHGTELFVALICSSMRSARSQRNIIKSLKLLRILSYYTTDETRLQRIIPYTIMLMKNSPPLVKLTSIQTLSFTLSKLRNVPDEESNLYSDYIFPALKELATDESLMVRICLADVFPKLAEFAKKQLERGFSRRMEIQKKIEEERRKKNKKRKVISPVGNAEEERKKSRIELREIVKDFIDVFSKDKSDDVILSLLKGVKSLRDFFRLKIPWDWDLFYQRVNFRVRGAYFLALSECLIFQEDRIKEYLGSQVVRMGRAKDGRDGHSGRGTKEDPNEEAFVIECALRSMANLLKVQILEKKKKKESRIFKGFTHAQFGELAILCQDFLVHPNDWVRNTAIGFFVKLSEAWGPVDTYCMLIPIIQRHLESPIATVTEFTLLESLKRSELKKDGSQGVRKKRTDLKNVFRTNLTTNAPVVILPEEQIRQYHDKYFEDPFYLTKKMSTRSRSGSGSRSFGDPSSSASDGDPSSTTFDRKPEQIVVGDYRVGGSEIGGKDPSPRIDRSSHRLFQSRYRPKGNLYFETHEHSNSITSMSFSDYKRCLLFTGSKDSSVRCWDMQNVGGYESMKKDMHPFISKFSYTLPAEVTSLCAGPEGTLLTIADIKGGLEFMDYGVQKIISTQRLKNGRLIPVAREAPQFGSTMVMTHGARQYGTSALQTTAQDTMKDTRAPVSSFFSTNFSTTTSTFHDQSPSKKRSRNNQPDDWIRMVKSFYLHYGKFVFCASNQGTVYSVDPRSQQTSFILKSRSSSNNMRYGPVTSICGTDTWMVSGTARGFMTLWDLRNQAAIYEWRIPGICSVHDVVVKNDTNVLIANSSNVIYDWNLENDCYEGVYSCMEIRRKTKKKKKKKKVAEFLTETLAQMREDSMSRTPLEELEKKDQKEVIMPGGDKSASSSKGDAYFAINELKKYKLEKNADRYFVNALCLDGPGGMGFFSCGTDKYIRHWDLSRPENSRILSGLPKMMNNKECVAKYQVSSQTVKDEKKMKGMYTILGIEEKVAILRDQSKKKIRGGGRTRDDSVNTTHKDSVTNIAVVWNQRGERKLVSTDRLGVMKFWE